MCSSDLLAAALTAYRPTYWPHPLLRVLPLALALVAAFNLIPPAWTPARLLQPEFRVQTTTLLLLLAAIALSPFLALIPSRLAATLITLTSAAGLVLPLHGFLSVRPASGELYAQPLGFAWGPWLLALGLALIGAAAWFPPANPIADRDAPQSSTVQAER